MFNLSVKTSVSPSSLLCGAFMVCVCYPHCPAVCCPLSPAVELQSSQLLWVNLWSDGTVERSRGTEHDVDDDVSDDDMFGFSALMDHSAQWLLVGSAAGADQASGELSTHSPFTLRIWGTHTHIAPVCSHYWEIIFLMLVSISLLLFLTEQRILSHFLYLSLTSSLEDSLHLSTVFYSFTHLTELQFYTTSIC